MHTKYKKIIIKNYYKNYFKKIFQSHEKKKNLSKHIIMINLTKYELKLIAGNRGIKNYQNMSEEKLLSAIVESEHTHKNYRKMGLRKLQEYRIFHKMNTSKSQK